MTSYRDYLDRQGVPGGPWVVTPVDGRVPTAPGSTRFAPEAPPGLRPLGDDPSRKGEAA